MQKICWKCGGDILILWIILMFNTQSKKLFDLSKKYSNRIKELEGLFQWKTNMYIDFANVIPWQYKLWWNIDLRRLKQLFCSFSNINTIKFYYWTLIWDNKSEKLIKDVMKYWFDVKTKDVKIMKKSIDISSIPINSPTILENFIRKPLLDNLKISDIEYLNKRLKDLNKDWILYLEDKKCNFDVEIGTDILVDLHWWDIKTFIIWSWDSDFADIVTQLMQSWKKVYIFSTARKVSRELNQTGVKIYDIKKIRDFICWSRNIK